MVKYAMVSNFKMTNIQENIWKTLGIVMSDRSNFALGEKVRRVFETVSQRSTIKNLGCHNPKKIWSEHFKQILPPRF